MEINRGDIVICAPPGDYGKPRPAVVVQSDLFNGTHSSITICPITTHLHDAPLFRVPLPPGQATGLKEDSQVMVDKAVAVPKSKIASRAGSLNADQMREIARALRLWLEL